MPQMVNFLWPRHEYLASDSQYLYKKSWVTEHLCIPGAKQTKWRQRRNHLTSISALTDLTHVCTHTKTWTQMQVNICTQKEKIKFTKQKWPSGILVINKVTENHWQWKAIIEKLSYSTLNAEENSHGFIYFSDILFHSNENLDIHSHG